MGTQVPIGIGAYALHQENLLLFLWVMLLRRKITCLGALGWAATTKNYLFFFIVEDNNLSILTEKKGEKKLGHARCG